MSSKCIARNTVSVQTVSQIKAAMTTWQTNFTHGIAIVLFSFRSGMVSTCSFRGLAAQKCAKTSCRAHSSEARSAVESNLRNPLALFPGSIELWIRSVGNALLFLLRNHSQSTNRNVCAGQRIRSADKPAPVFHAQRFECAGKCVAGCSSAFPFELAGGIMFFAVP